MIHKVFLIMFKLAFKVKLIYVLTIIDTYVLHYQQEVALHFIEGTLCNAKVLFFVCIISMNKCKLDIMRCLVKGLKMGTVMDH